MADYKPGEFGGWKLWTAEGQPLTPSLHIGYLPHRRNPSLYLIDDDGFIRPLAYFKSASDARLAYVILEKMIETKAVVREEGWNR